MNRGDRTVQWSVAATPEGSARFAYSERGFCVLTIHTAEEAFLARVKRLTGHQPVRRGPDGVAGAYARLITGWFQGHDPDAPIDLRGLSRFQQRVLRTLQQVPRGRVVTYGHLATRIGRPGAARAVGQAVANNPVALLIPCHRVVPKHGGVGHYSSGGTAVKQRLLQAEGVSELR